MTRERVDDIRRARRLYGVLANIPFYIVLALVAVAGILILVERWRRGAFVFGAAMAVGATLRAVLPAHRAGLLQVRSRTFDVATLAALGATVLWLATSIDSLGTE